MRRNELQLASVFSAANFLINMIFSYLEIYQEMERFVFSVFTSLIIILNIIIFLYFKKFLKYYYNFKDKSHIIYTIIIIETFINLILMLCYEKFDQFNQYYYVWVTILSILNALLLGFYMALASKLQKIVKKGSRLMYPVYLSFYLIPISILITFFYSLMKGSNLIESFEMHNASILFSFLKSFPFLMLILLYTGRGCVNKIGANP